MQKRTALVGILVMGVLASGCAGGDDARRQEPPVPEHLRGLPLDYDANYFALADKTLTRDPCALHNVRAGADVTGLPADEITPGSRFNACTLRTGDPDSTAWDLAITVGRDYTSQRIVELGRGQQSNAAEPVDIAGHKFERSTSMPGHCNFETSGNSVPVSLSVALGSSARGDAALEKKACPIGQQYLKTVATVWDSPPGRGTGATTPAIANPGSPCVVMRQALRDVPPHRKRIRTVVERPEPGRCAITDEIPDQATRTTGATRVSVEFAVEQDPAAVEANEKVEKTTINQKPAIQQRSAHEEIAGGRPVCTITTRLSDTVIKTDETQADGVPVSPVVRVKTPECRSTGAVATAAARAAADTDNR